MVVLLGSTEQMVLQLTLLCNQVAVRLGWMERTVWPRRQRSNRAGVRPGTKAQTLEEAPRVMKVGAGTLVAVHQGWKVDTQVGAHPETRVGDVRAHNPAGDYLGWRDGTLAVAHRERKAHIQGAVHQDWKGNNQVEGRPERKVDTLVEACRGWTARVHYRVGPSRILASSTTCEIDEGGLSNLESARNVLAPTVRFSTLPRKAFPCS